MLRLNASGLFRLAIPLMWGLMASAAPAAVPGVVRSAPLRCQVWHHLPGQQATDWLASPEFTRPADETLAVEKLEYAPDFKDPWGGSVSGLLIPPQTGRYVFYIASRDSGLLYLSSDETPLHRKLIAATPAATDIHDYHAYAAQTSWGIHLEAGKKYFVQVFVKADAGPGSLSIGWDLPDGNFQGPIPGTVFSPYHGEIPLPTMRVASFNLTLKPEPALPTEPGFHKYVRGAHFQADNDAEDMSYLLVLPNHYDTTTDQRPLLVFLHGNSNQGYSLTGLMERGPAHDIESNPRLRDWFPMIGVYPQLPPNWRWDTPGAAQAVNGLVKALCDKFPRIDRKRIYLTGLSMGGKGTWLTLLDSPQTYAAVAPISAVAVEPESAPQKLRDLPHLHIICGGDDGGFTAGSKIMLAALKPALGDRLDFTEFAHEGHGVWDHYYPQQSFYEELLKFSR